jgi:hypothetical protein|uniref:Uncharacterized protein n=1 Tax=Siphoviridae sp. ctkKt3 TaxID=2825642 RepID=A0A8S5UYL4_9CAUD|nr:MAG TPA: protein of unknown function (DUF5361) [Siphoviridae sp. ctkKt3]
MTLASMVNTDEALLMCDLAETYGIYDYRQLSLRNAAAFSAGLRENSRIRQKMEGAPAESTTILLASIADRLGLILASLRGTDAPESIIDCIFGSCEKKERPVRAYDTPEEFLKERYGG